MSLLGAVHAFLARECGADVADEAVVEYVTETVRGADAADAWRDLDELLAGLSPDVWGGHSTDQRQALLLHLWGKVRLMLRLNDVIECSVFITCVPHDVMMVSQLYPRWTVLRCTTQVLEAAVTC